VVDCSGLASQINDCTAARRAFFAKADRFVFLIIDTFNKSLNIVYTI